MLRITNNLYSDKLIAAHFNLFIGAEPSPGESLSSFEEKGLARSAEFKEKGQGYVQIQMTKPFTIGLAIGSSPLAVLIWIGEKMYSWSDPERIDPTDIIDTAALYFLSGSFATSVVIYNQVRPDTLPKSCSFSHISPVLFSVLQGSGRE